MDGDGGATPHPDDGRTATGALLVATIVVTHVGPGEMLDRCLASIDDAGGSDLVIVVDNSPRARSRDRTVGSSPSRGGVETLVVENRGFGAAINAGVEAATQRARGAGGAIGHVAVLNDDVTVRPGWLAPLLTEFAQPGPIGGVQPKLLLKGTRPPLVNSVGVTLDAAGAGSDIGIGEPDGPAFADATDIAMFSGGAVLLSAAFVTELGGFDERYFLYYEDVDLALRGAEQGWRYRCAPDSIVEHEASATTRGLGDEVRRLQERNRLWVAFRFGSAADVVRALWLSVRRLRHRPRRVHGLALAAGLAGAPRRLIERSRAGTKR